MIDDELKAILACPICKGDVIYEDNDTRIICRACRKVFSVSSDGIPNMLINEAQPWSPRP